MWSYHRIFILICLLTYSLTYAQERDIRGLVLVDFLDEYPEGVVITNKRSNTYAITDMSGSFHITVQMGDTLLFEGDYLLDRNFVVKPSTFEIEPFIVHMNYEVITLADVVAKPKLTGDLEKDIKTVKVRKDIEKVYANLGIDIRTLDIEPKERKASIVPAITALNVEALYKSLTGYYRRMENLNQFERLEKRLIDVRDYLGITYFEKTLGIQKPDIRDFLLYVYDHSDNQYERLYMQSDYLSMDKLLRAHASNFRERIRQRDAQDNVQEEITEK